MTTIQEQIAADEHAVSEAQAQLDAATSQLAADRARLASIAPHLSLLDQMDAELTAVEESARARISALTAQLRNLFFQ